MGRRTDKNVTLDQRVADLERRLLFVEQAARGLIDEENSRLRRVARHKVQQAEHAAGRASRMAHWRTFVTERLQFGAGCAGRAEIEGTYRRWCAGTDAPLPVEPQATETCNSDDDDVRYARPGTGEADDYQKRLAAVEAMPEPLERIAHELRLTGAELAQAVDELCTREGVEPTLVVAENHARFDGFAGVRVQEPYRRNPAIRPWRSRQSGRNASLVSTMT